MSADEYRQLAAHEAALARMATTNAARAQHYATAAYYTRLAEPEDNLRERRKL